MMVFYAIYSDSFQCLSCYGDAELESESAGRRYCYNKSLVDKVFSSSRWYYVLSLGFLVNLCIVVVLVSYILRWRRDKREARKSRKMMMMSSSVDVAAEPAVVVTATAAAAADNDDDGGGGGAEAGQGLALA